MRNYADNNCEHLCDSWPILIHTYAVFGKKGNAENKNEHNIL